MIGGHVDKDSCLKMLILALAGAAVPLDRTTPAPAKALGSNLCFYKTWNEGLIPHGVPIPSREKRKQTPRDLVSCAESRQQSLSQSARAEHQLQNYRRMCELKQIYGLVNVANLMTRVLAGEQLCATDQAR